MCLRKCVCACVCIYTYTAYARKDVKLNIYKTGIEVKGCSKCPTNKNRV